MNRLGFTRALESKYQTSPRILVRCRTDRCTRTVDRFSCPGYAAGIHRRRPHIGRTFTRLVVGAAPERGYSRRPRQDAPMSTPRTAHGNPPAGEPAQLEGVVSIRRRSLQALRDRPLVVFLFLGVAPIDAALPVGGGLVTFSAQALAVLLIDDALRGGHREVNNSFGVRLLVAFFASLAAGIVILIGFLFLVIPGCTSPSGCTSCSRPSCWTTWGPSRR